MLIGSHNAWSYLTPRKWWMKIIAFTARCQRHDISHQYLLDDVRCFDLHIRDCGDGICAVHGPVEYESDLFSILRDLEQIDKKCNCYVRMILDIRSKRKYTDKQKDTFVWLCSFLEERFPNISFWCGRALCDWRNPVYKFKYEPLCEELYGSVTKPKWLWAWFPWLYAVTHNRRNIKKGTDKEILLIDYVDIK